MGGSVKNREKEVWGSEVELSEVNTDKRSIDRSTNDETKT